MHVAAERHRQHEAPMLVLDVEPPSIGALAPFYGVGNQGARSIDCGLSSGGGIGLLDSFWIADEFAALDDVEIV
jgi:hypothetical protein